MVFVVFVALQFPVLLIRPERTALLFRYANIITACTMFSVTVWELSVAHGGGPLLAENSTLTTSSERAWGVIRGITTAIGGIAVSLSNQSNFNPFSAKPSNQIPGQIHANILLGAIVALMGILTTSAAVQIYGGDAISQTSWLYGVRWMQDGYTAKSRVGSFFAGPSFVIGQLISINAVDNAWPGGSANSIADLRSPPEITSRY